MGYIADVRRLAGSRPLIMAGASVLVLDEEGCLLLRGSFAIFPWMPSLLSVRSRGPRCFEFVAA
jgi:hypothetical protein